jgi:hypothetical protein
LNRRRAVLSAGLLSIVSCLEAGAAPEENNDVVAACRGCHQGALALERFEADELTNRLKLVRDGDTPHPPLNLEANDDCALADLAGRIRAGGSNG